MCYPWAERRYIILANPIIIDKQKIDEVAFEMVRSEGMEAISARNISKKLDCSTKPIYRIYENMDELKKVVLKSVIQYMNNFVYMYRKTGKPLLDSGLAYIHFAKTEKELFKLISLSNDLQLLKDLEISIHHSDQQLYQLVSLELAEKKYSEDKLKEITEHITIYTYGLAIRCFLEIQNFSEDELAVKLKDFFEQIAK